MRDDPESGELPIWRSPL